MIIEFNYSQYILYENLMKNFCPMWIHKMNHRLTLDKNPRTEIICCEKILDSGRGRWQWCWWLYDGDWFQMLVILGEPVLSTFFWLTVLSTFNFCRLKRVDKMVKSAKNTSWIKLQIKGDIYRFIHNVRYGWIRCG